MSIKNILDGAQKANVSEPAPYRIQKIIELFMPAVRQNLKGSDMLTPVAFVFTGEQWCPVIMDMANEAAKDFSAMALRELCKERDADCVVMITEAWTLSQEDAQDFMKNRSKYRFVSEHPRKIEAVCFSIETNDAYYSGVAPILEGREIKNPEITKMTGSSGRFTKFLEKRMAN